MISTKSHRSTVFLCHSHRDHDFVLRLANDLVDNGVEVWLDVWEMTVGDSLSRK